MDGFDIRARAHERAEMLEMAWALAPAIAARAEETERLNQLHPDAVKNFHESGPWRIVQPAHLNGASRYAP